MQDYAHHLRCTIFREEPDTTWILSMSCQRCKWWKSQRGVVRIKSQENRGPGTTGGPELNKKLKIAEYGLNRGNSRNTTFVALITFSTYGWDGSLQVWIPFYVNHNRIRSPRQKDNNRIVAKISAYVVVIPMATDKRNFHDCWRIRAEITEIHVSFHWVSISVARLSRLYPTLLSKAKNPTCEWLGDNGWGYSIWKYVEGI